MPSHQLLIVFISSLGLLPVSACGSNSPTSTTPTTTAVSPTPIAASPASQLPQASVPQPSATDHAQPTKGGQVVEVGNYHLELLAAPEKEGLHIDLYLLKGDNHTSVSNATVTANVQLPDGTQQTVPMSYNSSESHYKAYLDTKATGAYKVTVLTDIQGERINGRFGFKR